MLNLAGTELWAFAGLAGLLVALGLALTLFPPEYATAEQAASQAWPALALVSAMGLAGHALSGRVGIPSMLDKGVSSFQRFGLPAALGAASAFVLVAVDLAAPLPSDMNVGFPWSVPYYTMGALITEWQLHLLPVAAAAWLLARRGWPGLDHDRAFALAAVGVSLVEPMLMAGVVIGLMGAGPGLVLVAFTFAFTMAQMHLLKSCGFLAMLSMRMGNYMVWHVAWGGLRVM